MLAHPKRLEMASRKAIIRIYFDDEPVPYVEAPVGDFFGVMHGLGWYPIDSHFLSAKAWNGYNCYFPMPFARSARIEFEAGPELNRVFLQADWHRYPGQTLTEPRRFCAAWAPRNAHPALRRGLPHARRRWPRPAPRLRLPACACSTTSTAGATAAPKTSTSTARANTPSSCAASAARTPSAPAMAARSTRPKRTTTPPCPTTCMKTSATPAPPSAWSATASSRRDTLPFRQSVQMRFGCMANDICSTAYWYQQQPVRPFFTMPDWAQLLPGVELPHGVHDLALPETGEWWLCGPFANHGGQAFQTTLPPETAFQPDAGYDGLHGDESAWLNDSSRQQGRDQALWLRRTAHHGFIDFNHVFQPSGRGVGKTDVGAALARCLPPRAHRARRHPAPSLGRRPAPARQPAGFSTSAATTPSASAASPSNCAPAPTPSFSSSATSPAPIMAAGPSPSAPRPPTAPF